MAVGQGAAGAGNMLFALVAAHLLAPRDFAQLSAFLALYLVVNLPSNGLAALAALRPDGRDELRRVFAFTGMGVGLAVAAASIPLGSLLHLPAVLVLCLAFACPLTPVLAVARGRLYGWERYGGVVSSLLAEPAVRLTIGLGLAVALGAGGGAVGVIAAGWAAATVAQRFVRGRSGMLHRRRPVDPAAKVAVKTQLLAAGTFLLFGVAQNLDLLMANRLLGSAAPAYAALSTLGGVAAFASATVPLVLLPRAARRDRSALPVALAVAGGVGLLAVAVVAPAPGLIVKILLGGRYAGIGSLLAIYFVGMACLGLARVVATHNLAARRAVPALVVVMAAVVGQGVAIATTAHRVPDVAHITVATMACLAVGEGLVALPGPRIAIHPWRWIQALVATPAARLVTAATLAGVAIRLYIPRGIWLDEATSIFEARMHYFQMIGQLYNHDVHPPLYFSLLWVDVRLLGSGQLGVRAVSVLFGALIVPAAYVAGRDLYDRRTGMVAAAIAVVSPLLVWYSQEARMYSMFMLFALVAVWAQAMAVRKGNFKYWAWWVVMSAALGWTEYFGLFQVLVQQLVWIGLLLRHRRAPDAGRRLLMWVGASLVLVALVAPLVPFAYHQFLVNQNAGKGFGGPSQVGAGAAGTDTSFSVYSVLANILWAGLGYHSNSIMADLGALWPLGILGCLLVLGRRHRGETKLVVAAAAGPLLLIVALASKKPTLLDVRYVSGLASLLVLLGARFVTGCTRRVGATVLASVLVVGVLSVSLFDQQSNGSNPRRYDFQSAIQTIDRQFRPRDQLIYDPPDLGQVVSYYAPHDRRGPLQEVKVLPPRHGTLWILASRSLMSNEGDKYRLHLLLGYLRHFAHEKVGFDVPNVQVWEFTRK
ncbi:MAG TPA: glycosyltransferase family 39 protein [Acidimicrobiales bacterium]|nr:glycosyltransferase family 39 protein [Acidimicrobiales bacterium]